MNSVAIGECSDGKIVARSVRVEAGCYTSILNVTIEQGMINRTIECVYSNPQDGTSTTVGQMTLMLSQGNYIGFIIIYKNKLYSPSYFDLFNKNSTL